MMMDLQRKAEDRFQLSHIEGYPGDLSELGAILRHVSSGTFNNVILGPKYLKYNTRKTKDIGYLLEVYLRFGQ